LQNNKIKAVIFDFGDTLISFGKVKAFEIFHKSARLTYAFLKSCGQPVGNFQIYKWHSLVSLRLQNLISYITGRDFDSLELLKRIGSKKGIDLNQQQWEQYVWLWYEPLSKISKSEPDLAETLLTIKKSGIKIGILSNSFVNDFCLEKHLGKLGVLELFDIRLYSYQFDYRKPDPRIFVAAADKIGERLPNILFVGDRINKDIKPTLMLDMHAVLKNAYTNAGKNLPGGAQRITYLSELPAIIEKVNTHTA